MTDKEKAAHYTILSSLYKLYSDNQDDLETLDAIAKIAWSIGLDLNLDQGYGYHSLSELALGTIAGSSDGLTAAHYTEVIESSLGELRTQG